jgi:hypothetical protein
MRRPFAPHLGQHRADRDRVQCFSYLGREHVINLADVVDIDQQPCQLAGHALRVAIRGHAASQRYEIPASHKWSRLIGVDLIRATPLSEGPQSSASRFFARRIASPEDVTFA